MADRGFPLGALVDVVRDGEPCPCWGCGTWHVRSTICFAQPESCPGRGFLVPICQPCHNLVRSGLGLAVTDRIDAALAPYSRARATHELAGVGVFELRAPGRP